MGLEEFGVATVVDLLELAARSGHHLRHIAVDLDGGAGPIDRRAEERRDQSDTYRQRDRAEDQPAMLKEKPEVLVQIEARALRFHRSVFGCRHK